MILSDREETLAIAFKCFFTETIYHPVLQWYKWDSQREGLPCLHLNILLVDLLQQVMDFMQHYGAESPAHIEVDMIYIPLGCLEFKHIRSC